jgi:uncharacterized protein (TIRG00374 family)
VNARAKLISRGILGIAISIVAMWFALRGVDLQAAFDVIATASLAWLAVMLVCNTVDIGLRGWRWQRLVRPVKVVPYLRMLGYQLIGYLANNVLPARLGELVRSHYLGDREGISRTTALGTVVVERVIDTTSVVLIAAAAILVLSVRGVLVSAVLVGLAFAGVLVVGLGVLLVAHRLPGADRLVARAERFPRIRSLATRLREGLAVAVRPRTLVEAIVLTIGAWAASLAAWLVAGQAIGLELSVGQAALLSSGVALATAIPSGPGYFGTFELAAVTVGAAVGIPSDQAFALALIVHVGILAVTTIGGGVAFLRVGWTGRPVDASPRSVGGSTATPTVVTASTTGDAAPPIA